MLAKSNQKLRDTVMGASPPHHVGQRQKFPEPGADTRLIAVVCIVAAGLLTAIAIWPEIDLAIARRLLLPPESAWRPLVLEVREWARVAPSLFCAGLVVWFLGSAVGKPVRAKSDVSRAIYVAAVLAVGPGLLVNAGLKNQSHRPRPIQSAEVVDAGSAFRPFYRFDGACSRNCSFSSGEAASAFWTAAPALLSPPVLRLVAVGFAITFGCAVSFLRLALGAHFLSDVAFSALAILLLALAGRRLLKIH